MFSGQLRLQFLDLSDNMVRDLSPVLSLGHYLEELVATGNEVERLPRAVGRMQALRVLRLGENRLRLLADVERLSSCPNLSVLVLENCPLTQVDHYRPLTVHQLRTLHSLDGTPVQREEREEAAVRFGPDEVAALREEKIALEQQLTEAQREREELLQQRGRDRERGDGGKDRERSSMMQWSSPLTIPDLDTARDTERDLDASAAGTAVGVNSSSAGTMVGDLSETERDTETEAQAEKDSVAALCATLSEGLGELAKCDSRYAAVLEGRRDPLSLGLTLPALQGFEQQVVRLLRREESDLQVFLQQRTDLKEGDRGTETETETVRKAVASVQAAVVRQTIRALTDKETDSNRAARPQLAYLKTSAMAHEALRSVLENETESDRDSGREALVRRWQQTIGHLQKTLVVETEREAEREYSEGLEKEPVDWILPLAWRAIDLDATREEEKEKDRERLEGDLRLLVDRNGSLEREIALLKETSAAQLDALTSQQATQAAIAAQREKQHEEESKLLRERIGLQPEEQVHALHRENASLKHALSTLQMQHSRLEEDHATHLDLLDATVSKHALELERVVAEWQEREQDRERETEKHTEATRAAHARTLESSNQEIAALESQIQQLEQQSTARLVRGTASLEELTRENDALVAELHRERQKQTETRTETRAERKTEGDRETQAALLAMEAQHSNQIQQLQTALADAQREALSEAQQEAAQELQDTVAAFRTELAEAERHRESAQRQREMYREQAQRETERNAILLHRLHREKQREAEREADMAGMTEENIALRGQLAEGRSETETERETQRDTERLTAGLIQHELQQFSLQLMRANEVRLRTSTFLSPTHFAIQIW